MLEYCHICLKWICYTRNLSECQEDRERIPHWVYRTGYATLSCLLPLNVYFMEFSLRLTFLVRYVHARACVCVCVVSHVWLFETLWTVPLRNEDEDETVALPNLCCRHTGPRDTHEWRFTSLSLRRFSEAGIKPESIVKPPGYSSWSGLHFSAPLTFLYISTIKPVRVSCLRSFIGRTCKVYEMLLRQEKIKEGNSQIQEPSFFFFFNVCVCVYGVICVKNPFQLLKKILQAGLTSL